MLLIVLAVSAGLFPIAAGAQTVPAPKEEKLLNGLKLLVWSDRQSDKVTVKVRVKSGSAFDPKDKMGTMRLLADIMFPGELARQYFEEDLEGSLEVVCNYDYIQIKATGKASELLNILDTLRVALVNTPITQDNFVKVRDARIASVKAELAEPARVAELAAAKRLLGDYPYGRPMNGTPESLANIDRFDLATAKDRFLTADNSTLAITGNVDQRYAYKAARQLLGNWKKSDGLIPATFAQPRDPDQTPEIINLPEAKGKSYAGFAVRGLASNDADTPAFIFWTSGFEKSLRARMSAGCGKEISVSHWSHVLPGALLVNAVFPESEAAGCYEGLKREIAKAASEKVDARDFGEAQVAIYGLTSGKLNDLDHVSNLWLDAETFRWGTADAQLKLLKTAAPADGDRVAARVFGKALMASAVVGNAELLRAQLLPPVPVVVSDKVTKP